MADKCEKNLREKLKDYERPVPEDIWKGIEQGMAGRRKRGRRRMPIWYATAGIAAAACLLVVMYMSNDTQMQQTVAETERRHNARKAMDNAVGDVMGSDIIAGITAMAENGTREKTMTAHLTAPETDDEGSMTTTAEEKQQVDNGGEAENTGSTLPEEDKSRQGIQTEKKQEDRKWDTNPHKDNSKDRTGDTRRRDRGGRLSASIYGTGVPSSQNAKAGNMIMSSSAANTAGYKNMLQAVTPEPATEATHSIPFKFGVSLRYGLTRNIGLEGGVRYTMLKSKFTQKPSHAENHQDVGMIGIHSPDLQDIWQPHVRDVWQHRRRGSQDCQGRRRRVQRPCQTMAAVSQCGCRSTIQHHPGNRPLHRAKRRILFRQWLRPEDDILRPSFQLQCQCGTQILCTLMPNMGNDELAATMGHGS